MAKKTIIIVEDEEDIRELVRYNLAKEGYQVTGVKSGEEGLDAAINALPDLVILDIMLPGIDGLEVCRRLKNNSTTQDIPIIMLTAKGEESDIVAGLELGADDYIAKPFSPKVLIARIRTVLRRKTMETFDEIKVVRVHDLEIHPGRHEVLFKNKPLDLSVTEFKLLHFLASKPGWVFTRGQLVEAVHGDDYPVTERSIDVQIVGLRKKLGAASKFIETVRGIGYRFRE